MLTPGRRAAFESAVSANFNDLYRFAYWLSRNRWHAEDVLQESLLRAWRGWAGVREERAVRAWFFTIVRREFYRMRPQFPQGEPQADAIDPAFETDPASSIDMANALRGLADDSREALLMQVLGGFTCAEISAAIGASEGAVMARLTRARQAMRGRLERADLKLARQA